MEKQLNGWMVLLLVAVVAIGYGVSILQQKSLIPATVAQIAGNENLVAAVNDAITNHVDAEKQWQAAVEARLKVLETQRPQK